MQSFQLNYTKAEEIAKGLAGTNTTGSSGPKTLVSCRHVAA